MTGPRFIERLVRDRRGASLIELGIGLPVLIMLALGGCDIFGGFAADMRLQQYAQAGADFVVASGDTAPTTAAVQGQVASLSGLDPSKISVTTWTECNQSKNATWNNCPDTSDVKVNYMQIQVTDTYQPILSIPGYASFIGATALSGTTIVRLPKS